MPGFLQNLCRELESERTTGPAYGSPIGASLSAAHRPAPTSSPASPPPPLKLPSRKWRDLIRQAWHVDPLRCPVCQKQMRVIAFIDNPEVFKKILRRLNLWCGPAAFAPARPPPTSDLASRESDFQDRIRSDAGLQKCDNRLIIYGIIAQFHAQSPAKNGHLNLPSQPSATHPPNLTAWGRPNGSKSRLPLSD